MNIINNMNKFFKNKHVSFKRKIERIIWMIKNPIKRFIHYMNFDDVYKEQSNMKQFIEHTRDKLTHLENKLNYYQEEIKKLKSKN